MNAKENEQLVDGLAFAEEEYSENDAPQPVPPRERKKCYFVEPIVILLLMAINMSDTVMPNTIELQYCKAVLHVYDEEVCLNRTAPHFIEMQRYETRFSIARSCIELILPAFYSFFVGPWSDTFGRKPLMLSTSIGYCIASGLRSWGISCSWLHPNFFLLFSVPIALSGGPVLTLMATYCYICDVTTMEKRANRMALLAGFGFSGILVGCYSAPYMVLVDYIIPFLVASGLMAISFMYTYFVLEESVSVTEHQRRETNKNPFQMKQLKAMYETVYVKQNAQSFLSIMLIILLTTVLLIMSLGEVVTFYLYLQRVLGWTLLDYNALSTTTNIITAVCSYGATWLFSTYLRVPELLTLSIACFLRVLSALILMFAYDVWHVYLSQILTFMYGTYGPLVRIYLSSIIAAEDLGKVFSFLSSVESITPLLGSLAYNSLFYATVQTYPRAIFFLSGILSVSLSIIMVIIVHVSDRPSDRSVVSQMSSAND